MRIFVGVYFKWRAAPNVYHNNALDNDHIRRIFMSMNGQMTMDIIVKFTKMLF